MTETDEVIILGAGGHAKGVIETIAAQGIYNVRGMTSPIDNSESSAVLGYPILGDDSQIPRLRSSGVEYFIVGAGATGDNSLRIRLYELGNLHGLTPVCAIHPAALVSEYSEIQSGTVVFRGAILGAGSFLGHNVIINHGAIVEHDCIINDHVHVATGACIAGNVKIGNSTHIGAGATIIQGITIGANAIVAAGAVVVRNVETGTIVRGVPAA